MCCRSRTGNRTTMATESEWNLRRRIRPQFELPLQPPKPGQNHVFWPQSGTLRRQLPGPHWRRGFHWKRGWPWGQIRGASTNLRPTMPPPQKEKACQSMPAQTTRASPRPIQTLETSHRPASKAFRTRGRGHRSRVGSAKANGRIHRKAKTGAL